MKMREFLRAHEWAKRAGFNTSKMTAKDIKLLMSLWKEYGSKWSILLPFFVKIFFIFQGYF